MIRGAMDEGEVFDRFCVHKQLLAQCKIAETASFLTRFNSRTSGNSLLETMLEPSQLQHIALVYGTAMKYALYFLIDSCLYQAQACTILVVHDQY